MKCHDCEKRLTKKNRALGCHINKDKEPIEVCTRCGRKYSRVYEPSENANLGMMSLNHRERGD